MRAWLAVPDKVTAEKYQSTGYLCMVKDDERITAKNPYR